MLRQPGVLVCAQPTRGVDVGAIERIHAELLGLRGRGGAVLLLSADLDELLTLADRIAVFYRGRVRGLVANDDPARVRREVGALMVGAS
jgi:simple sugar transport system ATP-binding protein